MLETEKADGDKDVKSGLTHLVQPPLIFLMCGIHQGHSEEYWEQMGKAPGTSHLGPEKDLSQLDPVRPNHLVSIS